MSLFGGLAQLARALAWHARGHRFDSDILHANDNKAFKIIESLLFSGQFKHGLNNAIRGDLVFKSYGLDPKKTEAATVK